MCIRDRDRVAVATLSIFDDVESKPMYFHDFMDYLKNKIDVPNKVYLIALESIAQELYHQNEFATLKEYKQWRDAIEHNYFFLVRDYEKLKEIQTKYSNLENVSFAVQSLFEKRTLHLFQLCRSAIFSLVFLIRDESCERYFKHDRSCLLYTSPSPRDATLSRMPSSA